MPEAGHPPPDPAAGPPPDSNSGAQPTAADVDWRLDAYRAAYEEGKRALDDQQDELNGMRNRGVQFTAFVGAATAFLIGSGLKAIHRDVPFYALATIATALSASFILLLLTLLAPWQKKKQWNYRLSPSILINDWIEGPNPSPDATEFYRSLAEQYDDMGGANEKLLRSLRLWYRGLIAAGTAQLTVWAVLVWVKG